MADTKTTKRTARREEASAEWTDEERAAMKERARELKRAKRDGAKADGEQDLREKIAEMDDVDRDMAERLHARIMEAVPQLEPRTWYGMPAWAKDGKVLCFFTPAAKFKERYSSFGFQTVANLDDGNMWPTSWALTKLTAAEEQRIADLVKKAAS